MDRIALPRAAAFLALCLATPSAFAGAPAPPDAARWSGAYAGVFLGGSDDSVSTVNPFEVAFQHPTAGLLGGYAFQWNRAVLGLEADIGLGGTGQEERCSPFGSGCAAGGVVARTDFDGHLRAIAGIVASDNLMLFAAGGLAVARNGGGAYAAVGGFGRSIVAEDFDTETMWGYSLGAGAEYRPLPSWSLRAEMLYDAYGSTNVNANASAQMPCGTGTCQSNVSLIGLPVDFDHVITGRIALIHHYN